MLFTTDSATSTRRQMQLFAKRRLTAIFRFLSVVDGHLRLKPPSGHSGLSHAISLSTINYQLFTWAIIAIANSQHPAAHYAQSRLSSIVIDYHFLQPSHKSRSKSHSSVMIQMRSIFIHRRIIDNFIVTHVY